MRYGKGIIKTVNELWAENNLKEDNVQQLIGELCYDNVALYETSKRN